MAKKMSQSPLSNLPVSALEAELRRRKSGVDRILRKRAKLLAKVAELDAELDSLGVQPTDRSGVSKRFKNDQTLPDALAALLNGKTMSVKEAAEAVQRAGYRTTAANFGVMVNQALIRDKRFKKVSRGQYTVK